MEDMQTVICKMKNRAINNAVTRELVADLNRRLAMFNEYAAQYRYEEFSVHHEALTDMLHLLRDIEADSLSHRARSDPSYASRQQRVAKERLFKQGDVMKQSYITSESLRIERYMREGVIAVEVGRRFLREFRNPKFRNTKAHPVQ